MAFAPNIKYLESVLSRSGVPATLTLGPQTFADLTPESFFALGNVVSGRLRTWSEEGALPIRENLYRIGGLQGEYAQRPGPVSRYAASTPPTPPASATPPTPPTAPTMPGAITPPVSPTYPQQPAGPTPPSLPTSSAQTTGGPPPTGTGTAGLQMPEPNWLERLYNDVLSGLRTVEQAKEVYDTTMDVIKYLSPPPIAGTAGSQTMGEALKGAKPLTPTSDIEAFAASKSPSVYIPKSVTASPPSPPVTSVPSVAPVAASGTAIGVPAANAPASTTAALENYYAGGSGTAAGAGTNISAALNKAATAAAVGSHLYNAYKADSSPEQLYNAGLAAMAATSFWSGPGVLFAAAPGLFMRGMDWLVGKSGLFDSGGKVGMGDGTWIPEKKYNEWLKNATYHLGFMAPQSQQIPGKNVMGKMPNAKVVLEYDNKGVPIGVKTAYLGGSPFYTQTGMRAGGEGGKLPWDTGFPTTYFSKSMPYNDPGEILLEYEKQLTKALNESYKSLYNIGTQNLQGQALSDYYTGLGKLYEGKKGWYLPNLHYLGREGPKGIGTSGRLMTNLGGDLQAYSAEVSKRLDDYTKSYLTSFTSKYS